MEGAPRTRLFFALWPDEGVRGALARWARSAKTRAGGRLMRPSTLHLTLAFLGNTDASRLEALERAARRVVARRLDLVVDEPGYWPHNRIVWAGVREVPAALESLVAELRAALSGAGFRFDPMPFVPHVTLVRDAQPAALPVLAPVRWAAEGFVLVRSVPGGEGAEYVVQARFTPGV